MVSPFEVPHNASEARVQREGRAPGVWGRARPVVKRAAAEVVRKAVSAPPTPTVRGVQGRRICQMATLQSATWPFL
jgi:hypothetical protein